MRRATTRPGSSESGMKCRTPNCVHVTVTRLVTGGKHHGPFGKRMWMRPNGQGYCGLSLGFGLLDLNHETDDREMRQALIDFCEESLRRFPAKTTCSPRPRCPGPGRHCGAGAFVRTAGSRWSHSDVCDATGYDAAEFFGELLLELKAHVGRAAERVGQLVQDSPGEVRERLELAALDDDPACC
jgi:hypothetical protein